MNRVVKAYQYPSARRSVKSSCKRISFLTSVLRCLVTLDPSTAMYLAMNRFGMFT